MRPHGFGRRAFVRATVAGSLLIVPAIAQEDAASHPAPDSHELYLAFFFFHDDFARWTESRIAGEPGRKDQILGSSAKYLGVTPTEFGALAIVSRDVVSQLKAVSEAAHAAIARGGVNHAALVVFEERRKAIVQAGAQQLKGSLSDQSWARLHGYINNQHRRHVRIGSGGGTKQPQAIP